MIWLSGTENIHQSDSLCGSRHNNFLGVTEIQSQSSLTFSLRSLGSFIVQVCLTELPLELDALSIDEDTYLPIIL